MLNYSPCTTLLEKIILKGGDDNVDKLPMLSVDLVAELDKLFPERTPSRNTTIEEVMYRAGQRDLIRMLLALIKDTTDNLMDSLG